MDDQQSGSKILGAEPVCQECGAALVGFATCQDDFHELLFWENQFPDDGAVHHLLVLCYHLQHPGLYSSDGLANGLQLLQDFVENGLTPEEARRRSRVQLGSQKRTWKITSRPDLRGRYRFPVAWSMRVGDLRLAGQRDYQANVRTWAESILADLRASGNLPTGSSGTGP